MQRRAVLVLVAAAAAALLLGAGGVRAASGIVVDDDKAQCPTAQFTSIQDAVNAAAPGDTITVCAGTYTAATVDKPGLTLVHPARPVVRCVDRSVGQNPMVNAIVNGGAGTPALRVAADDVTISGLTVQGSSDAPGIAVSPTVSGTTIDRTLVQKNSSGISLNATGAHLTQVTNDCVRDNNVDGAGSGDGVTSDLILHNAVIASTWFVGQFDAGIILMGSAGSQSSVAIVANRSVDDAPIVVANLTDSVISTNQSLRSDATGIFVGGGSARVSITGNVIRDCPFAGINVRYAPELFPVTTNNTDLAITRNHVFGCGAGIRLRNGANHNLVRENLVRRSVETPASTGDGIALESSSDNVVTLNKSALNGDDGLRADAGSSGNEIANNIMLGNAEFDCKDDSTGTGTAGTANTWLSDFGRTQNRPGLCRQPLAGTTIAAGGDTASSSSGIPVSTRHSRHGE
jgi:nitrous oxidase accessory protein NosD